MPKSTKQKLSRSRAPTVPTPPGQPAAGGSQDTQQKPSKKRVAPQDERAEELRFKVTAAFKQIFKQTAKELGIKKGALLETLLAEWQARRAVSDRAAKPRSRAA